jgi:hypothetical protein
MKSKVIKLLELGLSTKLLSNLTESQIDSLYSKMGLSEVTMVSKTDSATIQKLKTERKPFEVYEKEVKEDEEDPMDFEKGERTQDPHQVGPSTDDGFGNYDDGTGEFNEIRKSDNNPWAICHAQLGSERNAKFERCVKSVKRSLDEGKSPMTFFIEEEVVSLVEKTTQPRITKGDLMKTLSEQGVIKKKIYKSPVTNLVGKTKMNKPIGKLTTMTKSETMEQPAPVTKPPKTKPTTKPGPNKRPAHPGKNPRPGENPAPKAQKMEAVKKEVLKTIQDILNNGKKN